MAEASQYKFTHKEVLELLVKKANIHEGKWMMMVQFDFAAGNFGPSETEVIPGAIVALNSIGIQRAAADSPISLVVDAAAINPAST